jgi:type II secretory pathway component PulF
MSSQKKIPGNVRRAAASFVKKRSGYYGYLANIMKSTKGETKLLTLFERDAQRYEGSPRGVLAAYWVEEYSNNGSNLSATWQGCFPDDEISIIRVAQDAGGNALEVALGDVARVAALSDKVQKEVRGTLAAAIIGLVIATVMLTVFPIFSSGKLQDIYNFIPLDQWGTQGKRLNNYADWIQDNGIYVAFALGTIFAWVQWSLNNWTGPSRDWADQKIVLYRAIRDIKGALFLATMATLTRKRGNVMFTLRDSLTAFSSSIRSDWLRWRVDEIVERVDQTGAVDSEAFATNLLSKEMYFFLRDTQEARGFADGFAETGKFVEESIVGELVQRMTIYRWVLLLGAVMCVVGVMGWQFSIINEMRGVMNLYYSSK